MIVTINTDASFHHSERVAAYAFWITCDKGRIQKSGVLRSGAVNPTDAEIKSIANALHTLAENMIIGVHKVIINTDCMNAVEGINSKGKYSKPYKDLESSNKCRHIIGKLKGIYGPGLIIDFRHVKAHTHTDTSRNWVNDWCDKEAKRHLWSKINGRRQPDVKVLDQAGGESGGEGTETTRTNF